MSYTTNDLSKKHGSNYLEKPIFKIRDKALSFSKMCPFSKCLLFMAKK
jgi:hypothetical protein